jgi:CO dehydrogenase/acetyl-CoA synthase gamma subunit (corrinoid Fe-S protein)
LASANLYLDSINFLRYFNKINCIECGFASCEEFIDAITKGVKKPQDCSSISKNKAYALKTIQKIKDLWPDVPLLTHPRPSLIGLIELNKPNPDSLVLISGNNEYTEQVVMTVLGTTVCPFFVIFVDTDGNTVDMAMIYRTLTAERVNRSLKETGIEQKVKRRELIIPGLASSIKEDIEKLTGWSVRVGPLCAAELPLFLSEIWIPPEG